MNKYLFEVVYPDGEKEYWYECFKDAIVEYIRLQKIHNGKVKMDWKYE